ncbi:tetratricopeptide repeat protein [Deminuibacter soli]|uniref:Uncharacterized protein n=1 Tax=Deminuibacter soli TaxID=2291815 RepID=A0A3E1NJC2_9BACT|nr:tetratricopeptide repeat protein [Deminuibacter soli]RFM28023.1 hypothetical protein DXN05_10805 [Deminuibacter soli]
MRFWQYVSLSGLLLAACKQSNQQQSVHLTANAIYNKDSVLWVAAHSEGAAGAADKLFQKAVDEYRNKNKASGSVALFKQSLVVLPQAKTYYELGNALSGSNKYEEAVKAYSMAEALNYKPLGKLLYNTACAYSILHQDSAALYYLVSAIEFGYNNSKQIFSDPDLEYIRKDNWTFSNAVKAALNGAGDTETLEWKMYARDFKPLHFPLVLDTNYIRVDQEGYLGEEKVIPYDYERYVSEMRDSKFSRDVGKVAVRVGQVKQTDSSVVLIYAIEDEFLREVMPNGGNISLSYYLVSYDKKGKLIEKLAIGGHKKFSEPFKIAELKQDSQVSIKSYKISYLKDPEQSGYESDNHVTAMEEAGTEQYSITPGGHFVKM